MLLSPLLFFLLMLFKYAYVNIGWTFYVYVYTYVRTILSARVWNPGISHLCVKQWEDRSYLQSK